MAELHMWSYWRDKYGTVGALEEYYPELIGPNSPHPDIGFAFQQAKNALWQLDERMKRLAEQEEDDE